MSHFLELPRVDCRGRTANPIVVNKHSIVSIEPDREGTRVSLTGTGPEGSIEIVTSTPYAALERELEWSRWQPEMHDRWSESIQTLRSGE
jgi:hypothetical protein